MDKKQLVTLLESIENYYPGRFRVDDRTASAWWEVLKDHNFEECKKNLKKHVQVSEWTPTVANLIAGSQDTSRGYASSLTDQIDGVKPIEEYLKDIEARTGMKVKE